MGVWPIYLLKHILAWKLCTGKTLYVRFQLMCSWTMNVTSVLSKGVAGEYFLDELKVGMLLREIQHQGEAEESMLQCYYCRKGLAGKREKEFFRQLHCMSKRNRNWAEIVKRANKRICISKRGPRARKKRHFKYTHTARKKHQELQFKPLISKTRKPSPRVVRQFAQTHRDSQNLMKNTAHLLFQTMLFPLQQWFPNHHS